MKYILENAGDASYAAAFKGYSTFVSTKANPYDSEAWERTSDCEFNENGQLIWTHVVLLLHTLVTFHHIHMKDI